MHVIGLVQRIVNVNTNISLISYSKERLRSLVILVIAFVIDIQPGEVLE